MVGQDRPGTWQQRSVRSWLAFHRQCHVAELAALDGISKAMHACHSEYARSEGQGDAAAYQTWLNRLGIGQDRAATISNDLHAVGSRSIASAM